MKDRLKKKLKAKKAANQLKTEKLKTYKMPDEYQRELQQLSDFLQKREEFMEVFPKLKGEDKIRAGKALKGLDENIEIIENELSKEYEAYQAKMRREEELSEAYEGAMENVEKLYVYIKAEMPHKFDMFHSVVTQDMSEEELQEFLDRIAVREANNSKALLASPVTE